MSNDELESQLSAMFDGELPAGECELLARRLARDDTLKARWGRYAAIGAAMRMEPAAVSGGALARRVSVVLADEPALLVGGRRRGSAAPASPLRRWWRPAASAAGVVAAAGVAAVAVFVLRTGGHVPQLVAQNAAVAIPSAAPATAQPIALATVSTMPATSAPSGYTASAPVVESSSFAPPVELVDFLVAHSAFSMPFLQRTALSALVASESVDGSAAGRDANDGADSHLGTSHAAASR